MRAAPCLLTLALFATALAGCLNPEGVPEPDDEPEEVVDRFALSGHQSLLPVASFEPTIAVSSDGTLFMSVFERDETRDLETIFRSVDQGATWESVTPTYEDVRKYPGNSNDPFIYLDPLTDRLFDFEMQGLACNTMAYSDDLGETWTLNPLGCTPTQVVQDHQSLFTSKPRVLEPVGYDNIVHYCVNRVADTSCAFSLDGGLSWGPMVPLVYSGLGLPCVIAGGLAGHGQSGPDGTIYLPRGYCGFPTVAISEDDGLTWDVHVISATEEMLGHEVRVAVDEAGHVYATWIGTDKHVWFAQSHDGGRTWDDALDITPEGVTMTDFPAIAAGAEGRVAVAFIGTDAPAEDDKGEPIPYQDVPWDANWSAWIAVGTDLLGDAPAWRSAPTNDTDDPIGRGVCGGTRCQAPNGGGLGDFIDIVIDAEGRPWAAFVDACQEQCRDATEPPEDECITVLCFTGTLQDVALGMVGTLETGPALRGELAPLPPLGGAAPEPAVAAGGAP